MDLDLTTTPSEVLDRLRGITSETEFNVLREKAAGFDRICGLLFMAQFCHKPDNANPCAPDCEGPTLDPVIPESPPATEPAPPVATAPEPAAAPMPADDPAPKPRRGRPPRARATEDAPSLLPAATPAPEPEPAQEAPSEPQGEVAPASPIVDDDVPW